MKKQKILFVLIVFLAGMICISGEKVYATSDTMMPTPVNNIVNRLIKTSSLVAVDSGYMRVYYDSTNSNIGIEYYDNNFNILSKKKLDLELSIWGGFYAGSDAYYIVEGQNNTAEDDSAEVIRVIKYDTSWNKIGTAKITGNTSLFGGEVGYIFKSGCVEMTEHNGYLYIVTGHRGYVDASVGQGHQGFLMVKVDEKTMTGEIVVSDLWHSFAQYIEYNDSYLYVLEQSEGSRYTSLRRFSEEDLTEEEIAVLNYGGSRTSAWAVECYASVDDLAVSSDNVLCIGTSIDQSEYDNVTTNTPHNIYLTVTPVDNFTEDATEVKWLTNYEGDGKAFYGVKITKINDKRFMISWEEYEETQDLDGYDTLSGSVLHYVFVDESGNKISEEYTVGATLSDCHPIVKDSKVIYYASNENTVDFYIIDANTGAFTKKTYYVGGENITWKLSDGVLTFEGTGEITVDIEARDRFPVSSTRNGYVSSSGNNAWKNVRGNVKKIVIGEGITSVPANEFKYFSSLTDIVIGKDVESIGEEAFGRCRSIRRIAIPDSVTSIGDDITWTGSTWKGSGAHVTVGTIYATKDSYAITWAKENNVSYKYIEDLVLTDSVTNTTLEVMGESTTTLNVKSLTDSDSDYTDMLEKVSGEDEMISAYNISTSNGLCFWENTLTFSLPETLKGKNVAIIQKMSNGDIEETVKEVDDNGQVVIETDELTSFMLVEKKYIKGDLDRNGVVNANDAAYALDLFKYENATEEDMTIGDINGDGVINANDAALILDIYKYGN